MMSPNISSKFQPPTIPPSKCNLLLVGDSESRVQSLESSINPLDFEITTAFTNEELLRETDENHDMVIIDAGPEVIGTILSTVRSSSKLGKTPVLVAYDRIQGDESLAGLLPSYRAMPCNRDELLFLVKRQKTRTGDPQIYRDIF